MMPGMLQSGDKNALVNDLEQLRISLRTVLDENARLVDERDQLRTRLTQFGEELRVTHAAMALAKEIEPEEAQAQRSQTAEELRIAFEELQVLTEELEVANTNLYETNRELDARVDERTRELSATNAALRTTEASLQVIADVVPDLLWRADNTGCADWYNQRWFAYTGQSEQESLGNGWLDAVHPADQEVARTAWGLAVESGRAYHNEQRMRRADGAYRWFLIRAEPLRDERGQVVSWFGSSTDIHDTRIAMDALQRSEVRFRTLVEGMPQLVWRAIDGGHWTWSSPQWSTYTGQDDHGALGLGWLDMLHPEDREPAMAAWEHAQEAGALDMEGRVFHQSEHRYRHFRTRALAVRDRRGELIEWLGTSTDVDDLLQLQSEQTVLVGELQHRTRNLMAIVRAITRRTIQGTATFDAFAERIDKRFAALARVQSLLSRREGAARVPFDVLLREEISAHVELDSDGRGKQVTLEGPPGIPLRSASVQTLALAIHELATNATKYGALSQPGGHLHIKWIVEEAASAKRLCVDWRESGVAGVPQEAVAAKGGGYGRELIERALPYQLGARTTYAFEPDGVHCTIEVLVPAEDGVSIEH
jgi:two-component system CheB/CheR fusion protein